MEVINFSEDRWINDVYLRQGSNWLDQGRFERIKNLSEFTLLLKNKVLVIPTKSQLEKD